MVSSHDEQAFEQVVHEWRALESGAATATTRRDTELILTWTERYERLRQETASLKSRGAWRGGPRTLLHALDKQHNELALTRALAWMLRPDGHHGLGDALLRELLVLLGLEVRIESPVTVTLEETREETRADLVLRMPGLTLLIESKVWAGEQIGQCYRLASLWEDEDPTLVFLTRSGGPPSTAGEYTPEWLCLRWSEVAAAIRSASAERNPAPGVSDFEETLTLFHP